jgi:hypothetical protein
MAETGDGTGGIRRPLLGKGEGLQHPATRPRGPNDKYHPVSIREAWQLLGPQASRLATGVDSMPDGARGKHVVFEATLLPNYLASTYFPGEVLDRSDVYVVGSRSARAAKKTKTKTEPDQATRTLILAGPPAAVKGFAARLTVEPGSAAAMKDWEQLRRFAAITLPSKEHVIVRRPNGAAVAATFEAVLTHVFDTPDHEEEWADFHFRRFAKWVAARGGIVDIDYRRDLRGLSFVPVFLPSDALDAVADFNLLRAIRPMPEIAPLPDDIFRMAATPPTPSAMAEDGEVPEQVVAVFDGGVDDKLAVFAPFVRAFDLTSEPHDPRAMRHGSMVTSSVLYGHVNMNEPQLPNPTACVDHYRVFPFPAKPSSAPDHRLYDMLDQMLRTLRTKDYSLVSLSIGPNESIEDSAEPDRFTSELDALAQERAITFIAAVGNNGTLDTALGLDRVQPPGDMVNGIGVGAITRSARDPKREYERAPYSARGPGREGQRVQPMVVEFGGSAAEQFVGFDAQGRLAQAIGTSFAGPSGARSVAGLRALLSDERRHPDVLRAFSAHFAERASRGHTKRLLDLGYGRVPASFEPHFECAPDEVTVLYEHELPRGKSIAFPFPVPRDLAPSARLELSWTISFLSEVDPKAGVDYTLSGIELMLRPDSRVHTLTDPATKAQKEVRVDLDRADIESALARGWSLSEEPKTHSGWLRTKGEQKLRQSGKWETLLSGRVPAKGEDVFEPRLDLQHLRREKGQLINGEWIEPLRFAMLVTIRSTDGTPIYDRVRADFEVLVPVVEVVLPLSVVA